PETDFSPVGKIAEGTLLIVASPSFPANTVKELADLGRNAPGEYFYSSPGNGSLNQLATVLFEKEANASFQHVPYKGAPASVADVAGGQVGFTFSALASAAPLLDNGQLKLIAVTN